MFFLSIDITGKTVQQFFPQGIQKRDDFELGVVVHTIIPLLGGRDQEHQGCMPTLAKS
jgi:hypothetical protein